MSVHENYLKMLEQYQAELLKQTGKTFAMPPASYYELKPEYLVVEPGVRIIAKIPFQHRFTNPIGLYQGGILAGALDEIFGPLSYMTAQRPCITLSMNVTYLKAFTEKMGHVLIEGLVLQKTKSFIFMRAEVKSEAGELIAHGETHVSILRDDQLSKASV